MRYRVVVRFLDDYGELDYYVTTVVGLPEARLVFSHECDGIDERTMSVTLYHGSQVIDSWQKEVN